ncbi:hypothetical protein IWW34DRAFT_886472 [Fusarium oxysporum f. sp. albedinis]|nr:hypothetical protein IWW34DRAFT_886472 [Fusarium oxysporum f. sp. albedinis]
MPFAPGAFAELRRVITNQHLSAGLGGGGAIGLTSPTPHKQQGKTLKTTRDATAKSSLQTMNIWVVEEDTLGVLLGCSVRGCKWINSCETRSASQERSCEVARNRIDNLRGAAYNGSDGRLGGRAAVTTLSIWPERTDARVGLPRGQEPKDGHRGWDFGLAVEVGLRSKLVLTCEPAVPRAKSGTGSKGMQGRGSR